MVPEIQAGSESRKQTTIVIVSNSEDSELVSFLGDEYKLKFVAQSVEDYSASLHNDKEMRVFFYDLSISKDQVQSSGDDHSQSVRDPLEQFVDICRESNPNNQIIGYGNAIDYRKAIHFMKCGGRTIIEFPSFKAECVFEVEKAIDAQNEIGIDSTVHDRLDILKNPSIVNSIYKKIKKAQTTSEALILDELLSLVAIKEGQEISVELKKQLKNSLTTLNALVHQKDTSVLAQHILIVEDDEHIRTIYQTCFEKFCKVTAVESGEEGLEYLSSHQSVSVVVLDIGLDKITGDRMVQSIKELNPLCDVVMVTTYKDIELIVSCIKQGATEYCLKQMDLDEIIQSVLETLEKNIIKTSLV